MDYLHYSPEVQRGNAEFTLSLYNGILLQFADQL